MDSTRTQERIYFQELKIKVRNKVEVQLQIRKEFKDWSGNDIHTFQEDLEDKCKSTVSEKWVYLHFKNENEKLPRVDVLNLLSEYCGYKNWDDFKFQNTKKESSLTKKKGKPVGILIAIVLFMISIFWFSSQTNETTIIFKDAYTHEIINTDELKVDFQNIAAKNTNTTATAISFSIDDLDTATIDGAYYKLKKIAVNSSQSVDTLEVELLPDDYALMLNYFSRAKSNNWEKRRAQLEEAIHDDAKLFQVHADLNGIEMLNKQEFIDRLILPINSLKNLEIQHIIYEDGQIYRLRFIQKTEEHENK